MNQNDFFFRAFKSDKTKEEKVRSSIEQVIIKTIKSGQHTNIEHKPNSFEIYGFDFMLD